MEKVQNKRDVVFAIFLIFIGSIFLLNSTGVIGWGIWQHILRFWPIFLILAGIKLIFDKSTVAEIIIAIIAFILFACVAMFSYISYTAQSLPFIPRVISRHIKENPEWFSGVSGTEVEETERIEFEDYEDVQERVLDINVGASKFTLTDEVEMEEYLVLESNYVPGYIEPSLRSRLVGDSLDITFRTETARRFFFWGGSFSPEFNLILGRVEVPTSLNIQLGAGKGIVNLENVNLSEIKTSVGAGKLDITLRENAIAEKITLELGAGKTTLNLPEDIGYELSYELGVGRISTNNESIADFIGEDTSFKSPNYDEATRTIQISAKVGVGSLEINNN